jgi:hypothetical protein
MLADGEKGWPSTIGHIDVNCEIWVLGSGYLNSLATSSSPQKVIRPLGPSMFDTSACLGVKWGSTFYVNSLSKLALGWVQNPYQHYKLRMDCHATGHKAFGM